MPWIDKEKCTGCTICVKNCPVGAIDIKNEKAEIDMSKCIRCGKCHKICPQDAVRHDSEKIPQEIEENIELTRRLMKHHKTREEKQKFLERMDKHFNKEKIVAEKSLNKIKEIEVDEK